jgi:hypothetical protein
VRSRIIKSGVLLGDVTSVQCVCGGMCGIAIYIQRWPSCRKNGVHVELFSRANGILSGHLCTDDDVLCCCLFLFVLVVLFRLVAALCFSTLCVEKWM